MSLLYPAVFVSNFSFQVVIWFLQFLNYFQVGCAIISLSSLKCREPRNSIEILVFTLIRAYSCIVRANLQYARHRRYARPSRIELTLFTLRSSLGLRLYVPSTVVRFIPRATEIPARMHYASTNSE